jgi:hypothetical protein
MLKKLSGVSICAKKIYLYVLKKSIYLSISSLVFFKKDSMSIALAFKKKKQLYVMSRSEHHHYKDNTCTQQNTTPPQLEERSQN